MQKIVLFIEPQEFKHSTPLKIGNLFMNRFGIDEDGSHEILKVYHLENRFWKYYCGNLTKNEGPDSIKQQSNHKIWKLNLERNLSLKQN